MCQYKQGVFDAEPQERLQCFNFQNLQYHAMGNLKPISVKHRMTEADKLLADIFIELYSHKLYYYTVGVFTPV